ncbi:MAG: hypothetical protein QF371_08130, partial [Flavobacteriales bacterium]|nr:hypothetical protein [Flavobacteriales bacterium]
MEPICAQSIRFSEFYDLNNGAGGFLDIVDLSDTGFVAVGSALNLTDNHGYSDGFHVRTHIDGGFIQTTGFSEPEVSNNTQAVIKSNFSNAIYSSGYRCDFNVSGESYCDFFFSQLSEDGDTLLTNIIERPDTSDFLLNMVETRPNKILLLGWTYDDTTNADADLLFITVDTLGNELNRVVWGGGGTDYVHSAIVINENGETLMTGYTKSF